MTHASETTGALAAALAKAQAVMAPAVKDSLNPHFKNHYADLTAVWDACRKPLTDHGLAVAQFPSADGARVTVRTVLLHSSGEWLAGELSALARDEGPQAVGSVITYLRRYGLSSVAGVAPDDDDAEQGTIPDASSPVTRPASKSVPRPAGVAVDRTTGEVTPIPAGYFEIDRYAFNDPWHEFYLLNYDAQGGGIKLSTRFPEKGQKVARAASAHLPIKVTTKPKKGNNPGEAYLETVEVYGDEEVIPFDDAQALTVRPRARALGAASRHAVSDAWAEGDAMRCAVHFHPCQRCGAKTECGGVFEQNYDGFPEVICPEFHEANGEINADFICEACEDTGLVDAD